MNKLLTTIVLLSSIFAQEGKFAVSILDFTGEDVQDKVLRACYQQLETSLIESNRFTVIEKNKREELLEEQKFQSSGVCDEACAVEIGQLVGAEYLMLGEIIGFADLYQVNIKIINIVNLIIFGKKIPFFYELFRKWPYGSKTSGFRYENVLERMLIIQEFLNQPL